MTSPCSSETNSAEDTGVKAKAAFIQDKLKQY